MSSKQLTPREIADQMPAPWCGMSCTVSLDVLNFYARKHDLQLRLRGDLVIATPKPNDQGKE